MAAPPPTFVAIDFETADARPDSACAIGLVRVEDGTLVERVRRLIRPPRQRVSHAHIHGLRWSHLKDALPFRDVW